MKSIAIPAKNIVLTLASGAILAALSAKVIAADAAGSSGLQAATTPAGPLMLNTSNQVRNPSPGGSTTVTVDGVSSTAQKWGASGNAVVITGAQPGSKLTGSIKVVQAGGDKVLFQVDISDHLNTVLQGKTWSKHNTLLVSMYGTGKLSYQCGGVMHQFSDCSVKGSDGKTYGYSIDFTATE